MRASVCERKRWRSMSSHSSVAKKLSLHSHYCRHRRPSPWKAAPRPACNDRQRRGDVYCEPLSEWWITPSGLRTASAMSSASRTTRVLRSPEKAHPTILRLQASRTTARKRKPAIVGTKVMLATQSWFGASTAKLRRTRSSAGRWAGSARVVRTLRRRLTPAIAAARISRATRFLAIASPSAFISAWTRGAP